MPITQQSTTTVTTASSGEKAEIASLTTQKSHLEHVRSGWESALSIALAVTAIAALLIFLFDLRVRKFSGRIEGLQDDIIRAKDRQLASDLAEKDRQIAENAREAGESNKAAGEANERAGKANERANALEVESLKLREQLVAQGPREALLRGEKRSKLVDALRPFAGQKIDVRRSASVIEVNSSVVMSTPIGDDTVGLSQALVGVLRDAGWNSPPTPLLSAFQGQGLKVEISERASLKTRETAIALAEALRKVPLTVEGPLLDSDAQAARVGKDAVLPAFDDTTIIVVVLTHP